MRHECVTYGDEIRHTECKPKRTGLWKPRRTSIGSKKRPCSGMNEFRTQLIYRAELLLQCSCGNLRNRCKSSASDVFRIHHLFVFGNQRSDAVLCVSHSTY